MKIILQLCSAYFFLSLVVSQNFYPGLRVHRIPVLRNGNITVTTFIETASPLPLVPRDPSGRRLLQNNEATELSSVTIP